jgi:glycerol uptake facilitator protein
MCAEFLMTFMFVFVFLIQTEENTRFSKDPSIWSLIVGGIYGVGVTYNAGISGGCLNPALGFCVQMVMMFAQGGHAIKYIWLYIIMPFVGGFVALIFHEHVYKNTCEGDDIDYEEQESRHEPILED